MAKKKWLVIAIVALAVILVSLAYVLPFGLLASNARRESAKQVQLKSEMASRLAEAALESARETGYVGESEVPPGLHDFGEITVILADGGVAKTRLLLEVEYHGGSATFPSPAEQASTESGTSAELAPHRDAIGEELKRLAAALTSADLQHETGRFAFGDSIKRAINALVDKDRLEVKQVIFADLVLTQP